MTETPVAPVARAPRPPMIDRNVRELAKTLYLQGLKPAIIERETGVKPVTLRGWAKRYNWGELVAKAENVMQRQLQVSLVQKTATAASNESTRVRTLLGAVVTQHAEVLAADKVTDASDLANTPARQGKAAVLKTLVDSASVIYDWDSSRTSSLVLVGVGGQEPDEPGAVDVVSSVEPAEESAAEPEANAS